MKTIISSILGIILLGSTNSLAQDINYGVRLSSNWGQQIIHDVAGGPEGANRTNTRQDYAFAIILEKEINNRLSIGVEPGISFRGNDGFFRGTANWDSGNFNSRLDYFSLPALAKMKLFEHNNSPYAELGPRMDVLLHKSYSGDVPEQYSKAFNNSRKFLLGGSAGFGFKTSVISNTITNFGFRLNVDFMNSYDNGYISTRNHANEVFMSFQFN